MLPDHGQNRNGGTADWCKSGKKEKKKKMGLHAVILMMFVIYTEPLWVIVTSSATFSYSANSCEHIEKKKEN